jgi:hydroxymethylbilane synthase
MKPLRIATRKSALALWQANWAAEMLKAQHPGLQVELVKLSTEGDELLDTSLAKIGGKGLFLKTLEQALLNDEADIAVHSLKDVPVQDTEGLQLACFLPRATPWDALVAGETKSLEDLPQGAIVGSSSLRRQAQLKAARPDLEIKLLRGNVDTRIKKFQSGEYQAILLATCGLERLQLDQHISQILPKQQCLPAIGQGIVVIQCRSRDHYTEKLLKPLHDTQSFAAAAAERSMGNLLGSSCQVPIAGHAYISHDGLHLEGLVGAPDGTTILHSAGHGKVNDAKLIGEQVAQHLIEQGALKIIEKCLA